MRIVFAGTPEFASTALQALIDAGHEIVLVLTQPDRPSGRGMKLQASAVKKLALEHNIQVHQPTSLRLDGRYAEEAQNAQHILQSLQPDVMVVAAYGLILPTWALELPRLGCLNIHASLLPRWRGAAPIHRAIEAGDTQTGVTIMQMNEGLDTGDMLKMGVIDILSEDTTGSLHDKLAALGAQLSVQVLQNADKGQLTPTPQPEEGITYAQKIDKAESHVNWAEDAQVIERRIRAFNPFPGVTTLFNDQTIKLWQAHIIDSEHPAEALPGTVLQADESGIQIVTGKGILAVSQLQRPGGKRQNAHEFLQSVSVKKGDLLK